jgi:hypothetical protein
MRIFFVCGVGGYEPTDGGRMYPVGVHTRASSRPRARPSLHWTDDDDDDDDDGRRWMAG